MHSKKYSRRANGKAHKWVTSHRCPPPPHPYTVPTAVFCIRAPQLSDYEHKSDTTKTESGDHKAWPAVSGSVWAHTENIQANGFIVRVCDSVIVLHPNRAGWRKVPLCGATGCPYCFLVARLPGIDKGPPGAVRANTFSSVYFRWSFFSEGKQIRRCSRTIILTDDPR